MDNLIIESKNRSLLPVFIKSYTALHLAVNLHFFGEKLKVKLDSSKAAFSLSDCRVSERILKRNVKSELPAKLRFRVKVFTHLMGSIVYE